MSDNTNRAPLIVLLIGLGLAVILLIVGVAGGVVLLRPENLARLVPRSATPVPTPTLSGVDKENTAVVQQRPTRTALAQQNAAATATAKAQAEATDTAALATEQARVEASQAAAATEQAQAAAEAILTAQAEWPVAITETFDNNGLAWPLEPQQDSSITVIPEIEGGQMRFTVTVDNGNSYENFVPEDSPAFTDLYAAVDVRFLGPNVEGNSAYGLVVRHVDQNYIFFGIQDNGSFRVLVVFDSGIYQLYQVSSSAIRPEEVNRLAVGVIGHDFIFLINDEIVWQITEEDSTDGKVGLSVDALTAHDQTQVEFDNLEVRAP
jgi:hypothetical protein